MALFVGRPGASFDDADDVLPMVADAARLAPVTPGAHDATADASALVAASPIEIRSRIGYMPESDAHIPGMTAVSFVAYCGQLAGLPPADRDWCERRDSNPHAFRRRNLNPVRLPIPPRPQWRAS